MSLSKKHYVAVAEILSFVESDKDHKMLVVRFGQMFTLDNPNFDYDKFKNACGVYV